MTRPADGSCHDVLSISKSTSTTSHCEPESRPFPYNNYLAQYQTLDEALRNWLDYNENNDTRTRMRADTNHMTAFHEYVEFLVWLRDCTAYGYS